MRLIIFFLAILFSNHLIAQRYLTPIFSETETTSDIQYGSATNYQGSTETLLLDFYEPKNDTENNRPLIIYAHGGGFTDANQTKELIHIVAYCDSMARRGYAVASIDYRLDESISNRAVINAMHDMKAAVRFFKKEMDTYKIDTALIFVGGESAGAVTALNTSYISKPSETSYPLTMPLADDSSLEGNSGNPGFSSNVRATLCYCGGTATVLNDLMFSTDAMETSNDPPILQVHGTADPLIPIANALEVFVRATEVEIPILFYTMEGATHCPWFFPLDNSWEYLDTLIDYTVPFLYAAILETTPTSDLVEISNEMKIFPNPTYGNVTLGVGERMLENCDLEIYNSLGQVVFWEKKTIHNRVSFELKVPKGIYFFRIKNEEVEGVVRFNIF